MSYTKKIGTLALLAVMITSVFASGLAVADHTTTDPTNADIYVDGDTAADNDNTYATIDEAVNASADNDTVSITPGTYQEHVEIETNNLTFVSHGQADGDYVVIDGSNTTEGTAVNVTAENVEFGDYLLTVNSEDSGGVSVGSGAGDSSEGFDVTQQFFGVPAWLWGIASVVIGIVVYRESE